MSSHSLAVAVHISSLAAQWIFLSMPPFRGRRLLASGVIVGLAIGAHFAGPASDVPGDAQPFALLWPIFLGTLDKFLCARGIGPEDSYWRVDRPAREARALRPLGLARLKWAAAMMFNTRGVRWNYEVTKLPPAPKMTKRAFLASQSVAFLKMLFMTDLLLQLSERLLWTPIITAARDLEPQDLTITHRDWRWSFVRTAVFAGGPYFFVKLQYVTASIIAVGLNLSQVEDWPAYFGNVSEVTTVRAFWGTFWHQTLRRTFTTMTGFVVDCFGIQRGTNTSSYTQLWLAFAFSGFMHAQSMLLLPHPPSLSISDRTLGVMLFFTWQAAAITLEDFVLWLRKKAPPGLPASAALGKVFGYAWVVTSFWISLPWAADVMMRLRLTEKSFLGVSLLSEYVKQIPLPPG